MTSHGRAPLTDQQRADVARRVRDPIASILGIVWRPMSIADIAKFTGLDPMDVAEVLSELCRVGRAREVRAAGPLAGVVIYEQVVVP